MIKFFFSILHLTFHIPRVAQCVSHDAFLESKFLKNSRTTEYEPHAPRPTLHASRFTKPVLPIPRFTFHVSILIVTVFSIATASAETLTLTTYYPAPQAVYDRLSLQEQSSLPSPCAIGTLSVEQSTGKLLYCRDNGSSVGVWAPPSGIWAQNGNDVFPAKTMSNPDIFVGIGTTTPEFKLTLDNDGGIVAMGTVGQGAVLADFDLTPNMSRLIWYPRKAAFRAGLVAGTEWNDINIGNYSMAFGLGTVASAEGSTVGGGRYNTADGLYATVSGGSWNAASGNYSMITGGQQNTAGGLYTTVSGIQNIAGGDYATIGGGWCNFTASATGATVAGGEHNNEASVDSCTPTAVVGNYSTVSGGRYHQATGNYSSIGGGYQNIASGAYSTIGGGNQNEADADYATIGGGTSNGAHGSYATVGGGYWNAAYGASATISGGKASSANGGYAAVGGGRWQEAAGGFAFITGGESNQVGCGCGPGYASGISGGNTNIVNGDYSWAGGRNIKIGGGSDQTFAWGYSTVPVEFDASPDTFLIYSGRVGILDTTPAALLEINSEQPSDDALALTSASSGSAGDIMVINNTGKIGIGDPTPAHPLHFGPQANGAHLSNAGTWNVLSSAGLKENLVPLDLPEAQAAFQDLKPVVYNYKINKNEQHAGFIAEDVPDLVASQDRKGLSPLDFIAVLTAVVKDQQGEIEQQDKILAEMTADVEALKTKF